MPLAMATIHHRRWNLPSSPSACRLSELSSALSQVTLLPSLLPLDFVTSPGKVTDTATLVLPPMFWEGSCGFFEPSLLSEPGDRSKMYCPSLCLIVHVSV